MIKKDINLYVLSPRQYFRFKFNNDYNVLYNQLEFPILIKRKLNLEFGFKLNSKKYIKLYLLELAQSLYITNFIDKNKLFFINLDAILIKNMLFLFPLNDSEIKIFNDLYFNVNKIYIYSFGVYSFSSFLIKNFFKKIKINLFFYKVGNISNMCDLSEFLLEINHDISNIVGDNILSNRLFLSRF